MVGQVATVDRILEAALPIFVVHGYAGASMEQVRREAGVSNGSLYHHFPRRAELAARLLVDGMAQCQHQILQTLTAADSAEDGVRAVVRSQLGWVEQHPDLATLLYGDLPDDVLLAAEPVFGQHNRRYVEVVDEWLSGHAALGTLVHRPFELAHALWLGPAQEFSRHWLRGRAAATPTDAAPDLAQGAWRALAAR